MARIRSVHPSLFTDEAWVSCGPLTRILYIGLWTDADDQGLFEWKPLQIKMRLLPGDAGDVPEMLAELEGAGLICSYDVGAKRYGAIANFRKFQRPQKPNAIHPLPENIAEYVAMPSTDTDPVRDHSATSTVIDKPMEDGGEDVEKKEPLSPQAPTKPKSSYPEEFETAWSLYPHHARRSSKPDSLAQWRKLPIDARLSLPAACARYRRLGAEPNRDCGAPAMDRWLKRGLHLNWLEDGEARPDTGPVDPAVQSRRLRHFRDTGAWDAAWGDRPANEAAQDRAA